MRILFVCDGNICRSPMAEAMLRQMLSNRKITTVQVSSSGLSARPLGVAHPQLKLVIGNTFRLLQKHRSRPLTRELVADSDLILGMENRHVREILERFPEARGKAYTVATYAGKDGELKDFPDSGQPDVVSWMRQCQSFLAPCLEVIVENVATRSIEAKRDSLSSKRLIR